MGNMSDKLKDNPTAYEVYGIDFMGIGKLHYRCDGKLGVIVLNDKQGESVTNCNRLDENESVAK
jgi:hypothetical protein